MLGGNSEFRANADLHARGLSPIDTPEEYEAAWPEALNKAEASVAAEHEEVTELGGLYVLVPSATSHAESITSCVVVPDVRVTLARRASTSRSKTN